LGAAVWVLEHLGARLLEVMLCHWHRIEINLHIVGVKIVIMSKLAN